MTCAQTRDYALNTMRRRNDPLPDRAAVETLPRSVWIAVGRIAERPHADLCKALLRLAKGEQQSRNGAAWEDMTGAQRWDDILAREIANG